MVERAVAELERAGVPAGTHRLRRELKGQSRGHGKWSRLICVYRRERNLWFVPGRRAARPTVPELADRPSGR